MHELGGKTFMSNDQNLAELKSAERRNFFRLASKGAFTAAVVAGAAGTLWSEEA